MLHHVAELLLMLDPVRLEFVNLRLRPFQGVDTVLLFFPLHELQAFAVQANDDLNLFLDLLLHHVLGFASVGLMRWRRAIRGLL